MLLSEIFEKNLKQFIADYKNLVLLQLKTSNQEYRQLIDKRTQISTDIFAIICENSTLNELIQEYTACVHDIQDIETNTLYVQGFKDCINMLK